MFDLLKKKFSSLTEKIKQSIQKKEEKPEKAEEPEKELIEEAKEEPTEKIEAKEEKKAGQEIEAKEEKELIEEKAEETKEIEEPISVEEKKIKETPEIKETVFVEKKAEAKVPEIQKEEKHELKARVSVREKLKSIVTGTVSIEEKDLGFLLDEFELALLESDVEQQTALDIINEIKKELVGKKIERKKDLTEELKKEIKNILRKIMETEKIDFLKEVEKKKPFIVLFLGPNGAGKTTSIAKLTHLLKEKGKTVVLASADTFRAGSIEQIEKHAQRLGVRVVKHQYGADPAAVAFDAVKAAEAKKIDVVLIDSAGRQETNKNLMEELKKIVRVIKPDLKIYVGEAFTGQALLQQATEYNNAVDVDGFILSKIDTDAKGGTAISLLHRLKKPVLFVGTGQEYSDLVEFKAEYIIDRIL